MSSSATPMHSLACERHSFSAPGFVRSRDAGSLHQQGRAPKLLAGLAPALLLTQAELAAGREKLRNKLNELEAACEGEDANFIDVLLQRPYDERGAR